MGAGLARLSALAQPVHLIHSSPGGPGCLPRASPLLGAGRQRYTRARLGDAETKQDREELASRVLQGSDAKS